MSYFDGILRPITGYSEVDYDTRRRSDDFAERAKEEREARYRSMGADMGKLITVSVRLAPSLQLLSVRVVQVNQNSDVAGLRRVIVERGDLEYAAFGVRLPPDNRILGAEELLAEVGIGDGTVVEVCPEHCGLGGAVKLERRTVEFAVAAAESREARYEALVAQCGRRAPVEDAFQRIAVKDRDALVEQLANPNKHVRNVHGWNSDVPLHPVRHARLMAAELATRQALYGTGGEGSILRDDALSMLLPILHDTSPMHRGSAAVEAAAAIGDFVLIRRAEVQPLILTLHLSPPDPEGRLAIVVTDMAGNEQAAVDAETGETLGKVREALANQISRHPRSISLLLTDGRQLLPATDARLLSEVSAAGFEHVAEGEGVQASEAAGHVSWAESEALAVRGLVEIASRSRKLTGHDIWTIWWALAVLVDGDPENLAVARDEGALQVVERSIAGRAGDAKQLEAVEALRHALAA